MRIFHNEHKNNDILINIDKEFAWAANAHIYSDDWHAILFGFL